MTSGTDWHGIKKTVDTSGEGGLHVFRKNLPYIHISWGSKILFANLSGC